MSWNRGLGVPKKVEERSGEGNLNQKINSFPVRVKGPVKGGGKKGKAAEELKRANKPHRVHSTQVLGKR